MRENRTEECFTFDVSVFMDECTCIGALMNVNRMLNLKRMESEDRNEFKFTNACISRMRISEQLFFFVLFLNDG